ncbi:MAG: hypothetical protein R2856_01055 [Caldilineaceae bacterium]
MSIAQPESPAKASANDGAKWVYLFDEVDQAEAKVGDDWEKVRGLLGARAPTWPK